MAAGREELERQLNPLKMMDRAIGDSAPEVVEHEIMVNDPNALTPVGDGALAYKQFVLKPTGLDIPNGTDRPAWEDVGGIIRKLESAASWLVGDWAIYAYEQLDMSYDEIAEQFGYVTETIETYVSICRAVPGLIRNQTVPFAHHRLIAKLPERQQLYWLDQAALHRWTATQMKEAIHGKPIPPRQPTQEEKRLNNSFNHVKARRDEVPYMSDEEREEFADHCDRITDYHARLARWARGQED